MVIRYRPKYGLLKGDTPAGLKPAVAPRAAPLHTAYGTIRAPSGASGHHHRPAPLLPPVASFTRLRHATVIFRFFSKEKYCNF